MMPDSDAREWQSSALHSDVSRAILVHGPLPARHDNAASLQRFVAGGTETPLFHYGPYRQAVAAVPEPGRAAEPLLAPAHTSKALRRYGAQLVRHTLHHVPAGRFIDDAASLVPQARRLPGNDPALLLARLHDMDGAIELLRTWEGEMGQSVEQVVLLRSDLAIYSPIDADIRPGELGIAPAEGFSAETGDRNTKPRTLCPYRNRSTGDYVSGDAGETFNADILVCRRADLDRFGDLYQRGVDLLAEGAPPDLDTLLHLILVSRGAMRTRSYPKWTYEVCRADEPVAVAQGDAREAVSDPHLALLPRSHTYRARHGREGKRVAVLLYGLLRDYTKTAGSIIEKVVKPSNASVLFYGPAQTDRPARGALGTFDEHGFFLSNPKGDFEPLQTLDETGFRQTYGSVLKRMETHQVPQEHFLKTSGEIFPREEWMFMLSPHRLLSMFHNINGAVNLLRRYENEIGYAFDEVVITRPDLAFYTPITPTVKPGELHIAGSEGFDPNGYQHQGNSPTYFYKNASTGDYSPAGRRLTFNDQVFVLKRQDLVYFYDIYDDLVRLLRNRVPASPETIFHMLMIQKAGLSLVTHPEWAHEIFRVNDPVIKGVSDTLDILHIDPHSPKAKRFKPPHPPAVEFQPDADSPSEPKHLLEHEPPRQPAPAGDGLAVVRNLLQADRRTTFWSRARSQLLLSRARKLRRAGNLAAAERHYAELLRLTPQVQREWVQYGHVLKDQGHWSAAVGAYRYALVLKPDDSDAQLHFDSAAQHIASAG